MLSWTGECTPLYWYSRSYLKGFFLKMGWKFREFEKSLKHELDQFKGPFCCQCLGGCVVTSWSLAQQVVGSNNFFCKQFVAKFSENIWGKTQISAFRSNFGLLITAWLRRSPHLLHVPWCVFFNISISRYYTPLRTTICEQCVDMFTRKQRVI